MIEELTDEGMDDIINAIENGTVGNNIDATNEKANLEDTETTDKTEVTTDTEDEIDADDSDTDSKTEDGVDGEDTQDIEDDADSEDEDDVDGDDEELDDTDGDQSDGEDDEEIEGDEEDELDEDEVDTTETEDNELDLAAREFYRQAEEVEFMVNGKKVKGLGTIDDMVKARQMSGGLNEKFKAIKELRPFLPALKERGMIENPDKFNLAMQIIDGDKEALKQFMQNSGINPLTDEDMDMDNIAYEAKNTLASNEEIMYKDTLSVAKQYGVEDRFNKVVLNDWDSASLATFFETPESAAAIGTQLSTQLQNGIYDQVMGEVANLESTDVNGTFAAKSDIEKYNAGSQIVNAKNAAKAQSAQEVDKVDKIDTDKVAAAKKKIEDKRKKTAYAKKVEEQKTKADAARAKATNASKKRTKTAPAKKADPYSLEGEDLDQFVDELMGFSR